jgi:hypothetical protein
LFHLTDPKDLSGKNSLDRFPESGSGHFLLKLIGGGGGSRENRLTPRRHRTRAFCPERRTPLPTAVSCMVLFIKGQTLNINVNY